MSEAQAATRTCELCGKKLSPKNQLGVCSGNPICNRERLWRYRQRPDVRENTRRCQKRWLNATRDKRLAKARLAGVRPKKGTYGAKHWNWKGGRDVFCIKCGRLVGWREPREISRHPKGFYCKHHRHLYYAKD